MDNPMPVANKSALVESLLRVIAASFWAYALPV
jgi:hypothetical protein